MDAVHLRKLEAFGRGIGSWDENALASLSRMDCHVSRCVPQ